MPDILGLHDQKSSSLVRAMGSSASPRELVGQNLKENRQPRLGNQRSGRLGSSQRLTKPLEELKSGNRFSNPTPQKVEKTQMIRKPVLVQEQAASTSKDRSHLPWNFSNKAFKEKPGTSQETISSKKGQLTPTSRVKSRALSGEALCNPTSKVKDKIFTARDILSSKLVSKPQPKPARIKNAGFNAGKALCNFLSPQIIKKTVNMEARRRSIAIDVDRLNSTFQERFEEGNCPQQRQMDAEIPPALPTSSPEVLKRSSREARPMGTGGGCFGAGTIVAHEGLSFVRDRRKCKPRGILVVGETGLSLESDGGELLASTQVPMPSVASVEWMVCDNPLVSTNEFYPCASKQYSSGSLSDFKSCESQSHEGGGQGREVYEDVPRPQLRHSETRKSSYEDVAFPIDRGDMSNESCSQGAKGDSAGSSISFASSWVSLRECLSNKDSGGLFATDESWYDLDPNTPEHYRVSQLPESSKLIDALLAGSVRRREHVAREVKAEDLRNISSRQLPGKVTTGKSESTDLENPWPSACKVSDVSNPLYDNTSLECSSGISPQPRDYRRFQSFPGQVCFSAVDNPEVTDNPEFRWEEDGRVHTSSPVSDISQSPTKLSPVVTVFGACESIMSRALEKLLQHNLSL